ncbi:hypothetical protein MKW94_007609 [Papaver nudicaule]|uniref:Ubiquitin-like domain-containing protein n=1 Tax=Papaver nudicaule TaxID=74823 RepID=A0AA41VYB4_PAPNU|nr:hypothetical protein [Papaver nudicaule]
MRKLLVHIAENGHSYELDFNESTLVESVQKHMESVSSIHINDQLLLCLDMKLEPQKPLSTYNLPSDDREVFLYNKSRLHNDSSPPPPEQVNLQEFPTLPSSPSSSRNIAHPLSDNASDDPALKALHSYEHQFRYHFQCGRAVYNHTQSRIEICERFLRQRMVQERALETARGNVDHYYRMMQQMYTDFMKRFTQQHRYHSDLLSNFSRDVEKLRACKLHPCLQTETRKCLLDFVKEKNLWKRAESCNSSHTQFETEVVPRLKQMFNELKQRVEDLFSAAKSLTATRDLELMVRDSQKHVNEQKSIMQSLSKDVNTVKKLVDDCLSSQLTASLRPHDAVSALGPMYDVHDKSHLPTMQACDRAVSKVLDFCRGRKDEMNLFVHNCMQKVACIQFTIRDLRVRFPAFKEAMARQDDIFSDLKLVRGIGPAYRACLAEIVRRKASMKLYMGMAGQLAERLATKREAEVRRRDEFLKLQSAYVPLDVLSSMGLFDTPNQCDVNIPPFDSDLLDIDISEVDRYAPECLLGMSSKSDKHGSSRTSFTVSNDGSQLAEPEDTNSPETNEGFFEDYGSVEIAGTSKMEVENARLKADLASALARICLFNPQMEYESLDDSKLQGILKCTAEKTAEALQLKDEYGKHLQSIIKMKQMQCTSYEKRIQELEQRLSDQYMQGKKLIPHSEDVSDSVVSTIKAEDCKSEISEEGEENMPDTLSEHMDEVSCTSASMHGQPRKPQEGVDENMTDSVGPLNLHLDSSMMEPHRDDLQVHEKCEKKMGFELQSGSASGSMTEPLNIFPSETAAKGPTSDVMLELQNALADKSNQCSETERKLDAVLEEVANQRRELDISRKLLDESQTNCAHLENCLHEAREEAHTHLCAADRRASEYSTLRNSAVKLRGLFERLKSCVTASGGVASFVESLRALSFSLANSAKDNEDEGTAEFRACIRVLADRVTLLSQHRAKLKERCSRAEAAHGDLTKELEEKNELIKGLYSKHQLEKQPNKERIDIFQLGIMRLSTESVALFVEHRPSRPTYILGQIVHIERRAVKTSLRLVSEQPIKKKKLVSEHCLDQVEKLSPDITSTTITNPYKFPIGCEYFVVTVAMLPDTTIHSPAPS